MAIPSMVTRSNGGWSLSAHTDWRNTRPVDKSKLTSVVPKAGIAAAIACVASAVVNTIVYDRSRAIARCPISFL
jgi:hypothetical protein